LNPSEEKIEFVKYPITGLKRYIEMATIKENQRGSGKEKVKNKAEQGGENIRRLLAGKQRKAS